MLRFPCLALDHDDTVVQSEATINYPCFCRFLEQHHPSMSISLAEYVDGCNRMPFTDMCKSRFGFTEEELHEEYLFWKKYAQEHVPDAFPGMADLLTAYKKAGGKICVVSMSTEESILRDYRAHFHFEPDMIFGWDLPEDKRKPDPYALEQIKKNYGFSADEILVVDDLKASVSMARAANCPIAFAGWGRKEFPSICKEMENLCDYRFYSIKDFKDFLFE